MDAFVGLMVIMADNELYCFHILSALSCCELLELVCGMICLNVEVW